MAKELAAGLSSGLWMGGLDRGEGGSEQAPPHGEQQHAVEGGGHEGEEGEEDGEGQEHGPEGGEREGAGDEGGADDDGQALVPNTKAVAVSSNKTLTSKFRGGEQCLDRSVLSCD